MAEIGLGGFSYTNYVVNGFNTQLVCKVNLFEFWIVNFVSGQATSNQLEQEPDLDTDKYLTVRSELLYK